MRTPLVDWQKNNNKIGVKIGTSNKLACIINSVGNFRPNFVVGLWIWNVRVATIREDKKCLSQRSHPVHLKIWKLWWHFFPFTCSIATVDYIHPAASRQFRACDSSSRPEQNTAIPNQAKHTSSANSPTRQLFINKWE